MRNRVFVILVIVAAFLFCLAASTGKHAAAPADVSAPSGGKPGVAAKTPGPVYGDPPGGPVQYFRARGENCYIVFSNFGLFGCHNFQEDFGFHYDIGTFFPPERYAGLYSWTDAPSSASYNNFVDTTTTLPYWLQLPSTATTLSVEYRAKWNIEPDFDGVELEIAAVGEPTNWKNLHPTSAVLGSGQIGQPDPSRYYYEGSESQWSKETADITSYAGKQVKIRFHFRSDMSNREYYHGIYVDELKILADGTTEVYYDGFENKGTDDWETKVIRGDAEKDEWGFSQALPGELNFMDNGQVMVGASPSYVADPFSPDWTATSVGWTKFVTYSNAESRLPDQPEYRVDQYVYPYGDFVIVDCYVKNGKAETLNNVYAGVRMNIDIRHNPYERDDDERVTYDAGRRLAIFYDDGQLDQPVCGLLYLHSEDDPPTSVNFTNVVDEWMLDGTNYTYMSNGEHDYQGTPSPKNRWVVVVGQGPHTLAMSRVARFSFALVGGDDEDDLLSNADQARNIFKTLPDKTPVTVTPASFGKIKAVYR
jgi:hypothetical protein